MTFKRPVSVYKLSLSLNGLFAYMEAKQILFIKGPTIASTGGEKYARNGLIQPQNNQTHAKKINLGWAVFLWIAIKFFGNRIPTGNSVTSETLLRGL